MSNNFFDVIGVADMERVHSAVIGWMLSDQCNAFGTCPNGRRLRSELLQTIFKVKPNKWINSFNTITSFVEWNDLDILIVTEYNNKHQYWVIENKVKSSQHSGQLDKYVEFIQKKYPGAEQHFCLLSLIEEKPICTITDGWVNTHYKDLCSSLNEKLIGSAKSDKDTIILKEYLGCISHLSNAVCEFLDNHTSYSNVFTDGSKKKVEKKNDSKIETTASYISVNGLETIFQKCFLQTIIDEAKLSNKVSSLHETRGKALVDFKNQRVAGNRFGLTGTVDFGYQFQNGSFKVQILGDKNSSIRPKDFISYWNKTVIPNCAMKKMIIRNNRSRNWSLCYLSFTIEGSDPSRWYMKTKDEIKKSWLDSIGICEKMIQSIIDSASLHQFAYSRS